MLGLGEITSLEWGLTVYGSTLGDLRRVVGSCRMFQKCWTSSQELLTGFRYLLENKMEHKEVDEIKWNGLFGYFCGGIEKSVSTPIPSCWRGSLIEVLIWTGWNALHHVPFYSILFQTIHPKNGTHHIFFQFMSFLSFASIQSLPYACVSIKCE